MENIKTTKEHHGKNTVGVVGTGDFGRAIGARLTKTGHPVIFGSRIPGRSSSFIPKINPTLKGVPVLSIPECLSKTKLIILAINSEDHQSLMAHTDLLVGKVLVDVSNPDKIGKRSHAEFLQELFPNSKVVKAFNTVSAYFLNEEETAGRGQAVTIAGDDPEARAEIHLLAVNMGLQALDIGGLGNAITLEKKMQTLFPGWGWPLIVTGLWFIFWTVYSICRYYVMMSSYTWERFPLNVLNKVAGCMAMTLLALCYLPGCIAAIVQLVRSTKYKALPGWMDEWLKMRKQLGLYGLFFALLHACMAFCLISPAYFGGWFVESRVTIPGNSTQNVVVSLGSRMNWVGETTILLALLSTALYSIIGITSLSTVGDHLNWKEWRVVQSYMGIMCLILGCAHVTVKASPYWVDSTFVDILKGLSFLSQIIPYIVLAIRIFLLIPCVNSRLWKIRRGYIHGGSEVDPELGSMGKSQIAWVEAGVGITKVGESKVGVGNVNEAYVRADMTEL